MRVNTVPYRLVRPVYTVPASKSVRLIPLFRTRKNTGRTGQFRAIPSVPDSREKKSFFLLLLFFKFCNF